MTPTLLPRLLTALTSVAVALTTVAVAATAPRADAASGSWKGVAAQLSMPVFRPAKTFGLVLSYVHPKGFDPGCANDGREQLIAFYTSRGIRYLQIFEGYPRRYCNDVGLKGPVKRRLTIHGRPARLYDLCATRGCRKPGTTNALDWCELGTTITLVGVEMSADQLVAIGRNMAQVDRGRARPCPGA